MISHLRSDCAMSVGKSSLRRPPPYTTDILVRDSDARPPSSQSNITIGTLGQYLAFSYFFCSGCQPQSPILSDCFNILRVAIFLFACALREL